MMIHIGDVWRICFIVVRTWSDKKFNAFSSVLLIDLIVENAKFFWVKTISISYLEILIRFQIEIISLNSILFDAASFNDLYPTDQWSSFLDFISSISWIFTVSCLIGSWIQLISLHCQPGDMLDSSFNRTTENYSIVCDNNLKKNIEWYLLFTVHVLIADYNNIRTETLLDSRILSQDV